MAHRVENMKGDSPRRKPNAVLEPVEDDGFEALVDETFEDQDDRDIAEEIVSLSV